MRSFQDTFETPTQLFISAFSVCMTVPLREVLKNQMYFKSDLGEMKKEIQNQNHIIK